MELTDKRLKKLAKIEGGWWAEYNRVWGPDSDEIARTYRNVTIGEAAEDRAKLIALAPELVEEVVRLRAVLADVLHWAEAYPLSVFPEPDMALAHKLLKAGGLTLDAVGASCMRYVAEQVKDTVTKALGQEEEVDNAE